MAYSNNFVVSVLVDNQVVREFANNEALVDFGSEYTIRFRNKNARNAAVKFWIDGEDKGCWRVPNNSCVDVEHSVFSQHRFKFVDLHSLEAQEFGKDRANKNKNMGLIECHFYLEKECPTPNHPQYPYQYLPNDNTYHWWWHSPYYREPELQPYFKHFDVTSNTTPDIQVMNGEMPCSYDGATVDGSISDQKNQIVHMNLEDTYTVIKLTLKGTKSQVVGKDFVI
jgi:hypothetical protein